MKVRKENASTMRKEKTSAGVHGLLTACIVIIIFCGAFSHVLFNEGFYHEGYEKHGSNARLGRNVTTALTYVIFSYFHNKGEIEWVKSFSDRELLHMKDVKSLIGAGYMVYAIAVVTAVMLIIKIAKRNYHPARKSVIDHEGFLLGIIPSFRRAGMISIALLAAIALFFVIGGFDALFDVFHKVFFPQGNWQFPERSLLIQLFPAGFFLDAGLLIYRIALITSALVLAISLGASFALARNGKNLR